MTYKTNSELPIKRPRLVWVISIFYFVGCGLALLCYSLVFLGLVLPEDIKKDLASLSVTDYVILVLVSFGNLAGAVALLMMKKEALYFFLGTLVASLSLNVYYIFDGSHLNGYGFSIVPSMVIAWIINVMIILYAKKLVSQRVLK